MGVCSFSSDVPLGKRFVLIPCGADSFLLRAKAYQALQVERSLDQTGTSHLQDDRQRWHKTFMNE